MHDDRVSCLVIGDRAALLLVHDAALLLDAADQVLFDRFLEVLDADLQMIIAHSQDRRFVDDVGKIGADQTGGGLGNIHQVDIGCDAPAIDMDLENFETSLDIGARDGDMAVKATGAGQSRVQHVDAVGGAQHNDALGAGEAVHLDQQLVEGLVLLHLAAAAAGIALAAGCIDLIDEDNAGSLGARLLEQGPHPAGTNAHEHLHELGAGRAEEGNACFTGNGLGQQGFACTRVADQQHATRHAGTHLPVLTLVLEEADNIHELFAGFIDAGNVLEA